MAIQKAERPLKIGLVWHYESAKVKPSEASWLHISAVMRGLQKRGHQVRIVTVRNGVPHFSDDLQNWSPIQSGAGNSRAFRLFESGVRRLQSQLHLPYIHLFESYRFSRACLAALAGYQVFYERFWLLAYGGLLASGKIGAPHFYEVNGDLVDEYEQLGIDLSGAQWHAINTITREMFNRAGRVIAVSEGLRQRTVERWNLEPQQVTTVENGAHVDMFSDPGDTQAVADRYCLDGAPLVMFVGGFRPWHGIDLLVEAFAYLKERNGQARLVLVGDGPQRPVIEQQARDLGVAERVVFTGAVPHQEIPQLLSLAQVVVVNPRHSDVSFVQSPLKLFEYMAAGKAIVGPDIPNIQRWLTDRETGWLVPPDEPQALAEALVELLHDRSLRNHLGQAAQARAFERHSWDHTVSKLEAIFYEELARRS